MKTLKYRVKVSSQEAMSCTRRRVGWLLADLGRITTERSAPIDNIKQSSGSNMTRSGSDLCTLTNLPRTIRFCMRGGTTGRGDGGNWFGVVKASEFTPEIIGRVLEASKATKRMIAVCATALTCMTVSTRKNSTYLYMIGMFKRSHARKFVLKKQPQGSIMAF